MFVLPIFGNKIENSLEILRAKVEAEKPVKILLYSPRRLGVGLWQREVKTAVLRNFLEGKKCQKSG